MLHEFLSSNRTELIDLCRTKVARRTAPTPSPFELEHGIPLFLDQLIGTLRVEQTSAPASGAGAPQPDPKPPDASAIGATAMLHGGTMLKQGFTVDQVVHNYGDLCQAITGLAVESSAPIEVSEFRTLNRCLDDAIAGAVTEFAEQHDAQIADKSMLALNERLGTLAHELRNFIHTAMLAVTAIKTGNVGMGGATGALLDRSLLGLSSLIDRSLTEVRVGTGMHARKQRIDIADLIAEVRIAAALEARARDCRFTVAEIDPRLAVNADRTLLAAAIGNLLHNAFKFTQPGTGVTLHAFTRADRVLIEISDRCGGLPPGAPEKLFQPFTQGGTDRSGIGLGLTIARRSVEASEGTLSVRDMPGSGCVFTIDLPRMPEA